MEGLKGNTIHRHHLSLLKHTDDTLNAWRVAG